MVRLSCLSSCGVLLGAPPTGGEVEEGGEEARRLGR